MITYILDNVAVGNSQDSIGAKNEQFDAILNVAIDLDIKDEFKWRHKVGLLDGPGNHPDTMIAAVLMLHSLVNSKKRVLVHCHAGKSRSVMITSLYVSIAKNSNFDEVLQKVMKNRGVDVYQPALYNLAKIVHPVLSKLLETSYGEKRIDINA